MGCGFESVEDGAVHSEYDSSRLIESRGGRLWHLIKTWRVWISPMGGKGNARLRAHETASVIVARTPCLSSPSPATAHCEVGSMLTDLHALDERLALASARPLLALLLPGLLRLHPTAPPWVYKHTQASKTGAPSGVAGAQIHDGVDGVHTQPKPNLQYTTNSNSHGVLRVDTLPEAELARACTFQLAGDG